ncbi:MAG: hypothetical protein E6J91_04770 [Deltaproteobacteria bacterium]|nr:MAG: hypothetical protein E6J91_04770 [Deltaproteobacteria bacterium]
MILELEHRTHLPTRVGNYFVRIDDDGTIYAHQNAGEPARDADWTVDPAAARRGTLAKPRDTVERVLRKHGFFDLAPRYEAPATQGGVIRTLTYRDGEGVARTVTVDRARLPELDRLIQRLREALGLAEIPAG